MNIIENKKIYFTISLLVIIPGLISLLFFGLKPSIDFSGGSRLSLVMEKHVDIAMTKKVREILIKKGFDAQVQASTNGFLIKTKPIDQKKHDDIITLLKKESLTFKEDAFETVGPTVGKETTINALKAILISSVLILLFIGWSFRVIPKPASSFRFGVCAIIALLHDILFLVGIFSLLGYFYDVEVDSLFVTAVLTVIGFSVHDTIVIFDRIRENMRRMPTLPFKEVVNKSIVQTMCRSINTSLTVFLVLLTMLLFGGETIRWFVVALLIGVFSGTYSSIFNAAPLLVFLEEWSRNK
ncbi:protein-export membrane protein SecF [Candidatus Levyibacteriota bacterium]|nr:protein translocase subunit SecF [Candidatus Levybacteria bacterium]MSU25635.1 protein translocase subunit SecF [Candidatus Levybacteria bacterium]GDX61759.1 protein-export membrane protein SecF [Candidatus Levybacteria bacterium]